MAAEPPPPSTPLHFPSSLRPFLQRYLPPLTPATAAPQSRPSLPHLTLTYATSLDSLLSIAPSIPTALSGPTTKAMTHYLRSHHDAILVGVGTAIADDPGLNCRLEGCTLANQPRPVVLDPAGRWDVRAESRVVRTAREGRGKGLWVLVGDGVEYLEERRKIIEESGGMILQVPLMEGSQDIEGPSHPRMRWRDILTVLRDQGRVRSLMVEGGGRVINDLYEEENQGTVSSVVITIAPVYLGRGGVGVSPVRGNVVAGKAVPAVEYKDVSWQAMEDDMVFGGKVKGVDHYELST